MSGLTHKIAAVAIAIAFASVAHGSGREVSVTISTPSTSVRVGQAIPIKIQLTNMSGRQLRVGRVVARGQAELDYKVTMMDSEDHPVPRTSYGTAASKRQVIIVSQKTEAVQPRQTVTQRTELTKLFNITKPGTYTVRVGREWPPKTGKMEWSNSLTLTVTP